MSFPTFGSYFWLKQPLSTGEAREALGRYGLGSVYDSRVHTDGFCFAQPHAQTPDLIQAIIISDQWDEAVWKLLNAKNIQVEKVPILEGVLSQCALHNQFQGWKFAMINPLLYFGALMPGWNPTDHLETIAATVKRILPRGTPPATVCQQLALVFRNLQVPEQAVQKYLPAQA